MEDKNVKMAEQIARAVNACGGRTFYVGGLVRDRLLGIDNKDIDIEVHGVTPEKLAEILDSFGKRTEMGANFGIFGLRGYDVDIAMPRKEEATGRGHKDFAVFVDPFLGTQKAAKRRDFTMNALMEDVLTGEVIDHFGGIEDLKAGVLRHVNAETFVEDPLRVLRAAQFASRFHFTVADETIALIKGMELDALAKERIMGELEKALLKSDRPSIFFEEMRRMEQMDVWFPEVDALYDVPQDPRWHPEGSVWNHTMMVLDRAASVRSQAQRPLSFMLAALVHDFGKAVTTTTDPDGRIRSKAHEEKGLPIVETFIKRITNETKVIRYVLNMTKLHMRPNMNASQNAGQKAMNRLFDESVEPKDLLLLAEADNCGRAGEHPYEDKQRFLLEKYAVFEEMMSHPYVMGADLVKAGYQPGADFSKVLAYAHKLRLSGVEKPDALKQTLSYLEKVRSRRNG